MKTTSTVFRNMVFDERIFIMVGVGCALNAKIAEKLNAEALIVSGGATSGNVLGLPDAGFLTQTELVENARRICDATRLPVMVDCDTGFGNAINARRTVWSIIKAGAAALLIEDQVAPKRCGFLKGKQVIPLDEAVGKYRAALDARDELDPDFVIMARCDARTAVGGSVEEVITRLKAYKAAGVDIVMAEGLTSWEEVTPIRASIDGPLYITPYYMRPRPTLEQLQEAGICMTTFHVEGAGWMALWDLLTRIKEAGFDGGQDYLAALGRHPLGTGGISDLVGRDEVRDLEERYLAPSSLKT